jgi:hypothetical protein
MRKENNSDQLQQEDQYYISVLLKWQWLIGCITLLYHNSLDYLIMQLMHLQKLRINYQKIE